MLIHSLLTLSAVLAFFIFTLYAHRSAPRRQVRIIEQLYRDAIEEVDKLAGRVTKLNANHALLLAREKRHAKPDEETNVYDSQDVLRQRPGETGQEWKQRIRGLQNAGRINLKHT